MTTVRSALRGACVLLGVLAATPAAPAQVKYPPRPEKVDVQIRYRIRADRDERVRQFRVLETHLKDLGFERKRQPDDELDVLDPLAERFEGVIPSKNVFALLDDPRVKTILFKPTDLQYPDDIAKPVSVRIRIATGYLPADQQRLHRQVVAQLEKLGFREFVGYDHDRYTLVRGDLPSGNVARLLKDLRAEPAGWFLLDTPRTELPAPLRETLPIRSVEVLANSDLVLLNPQPLPPNRAKYTPDMRALLDTPAALGKPIRVEVVMDRTIGGDDLELIRARLRGNFSRQIVNPATQLSEPMLATLEGVAGNIATIHFPLATDVERFANDPSVVVVRMPCRAIETTAPLQPKATTTPAADVLQATRLAAFHKLGHRGRGTRIVVIATEFPELGSAVGARFLDKSLRTPVAFIDLTAELAANLQPAAPGTASGAGTAAARAAHLAAPDAGLFLVRVDPAALFQVLSLAQFVRGDIAFTEAMQSRIAELTIQGGELRRKNIAAVDEYRKAFQDLSDDDGPTERRVRAKKVLDLLIHEEAEHAATIVRATLLQNQMRELVGCDVVVNTLVWETGFPLDGLSALGQTIEMSYASAALAGPRTRSASRPRPAPRPLWVQATSPSVGSVWGGPFLDPDSNGAMDFTAASAKLPAGDWTRELNFLAARAPDGSVAPTLALGAKVRLTVQWREAHDAATYGGQDSIFPLAFRVFQQLDPDGKVRASDELTEIARSLGGPYRIYAEPGYGIYEQIIEFTAPADGRYCVMLEGQTVFDHRLPALYRHLEIQPRMFAEFVGTTPDKGRPAFASFAPRNVGVGIPGDVKASIAVSATDAPLGTTTTGLTGGGTGLDLLQKPDLLADGSIDVGALKVGGSGLAAGFAGGVLAGLVASGAPPADIIRATGLKLGGPVSIPEGWLKVVPPRTKP